MKLNIIRGSSTIGHRYIKREILLPSRFFLAPINTGFVSEGRPNQHFFDFHQQRSGRGLGITYVGNVSIGREWVTNPNTAVISNNLNDWEKLVSIIERNGSVPGVQLACRAATEKPLQGWKRKNAESFIKTIRTQLAEISKEKIDAIFESFFYSAQLAIKAGFKVIQIHAAHGYFLGQLLDSRLNIRDDCYGRDPLSALYALISDIRSIDRDILIDIRLSLVEGLENNKVEYSRKVDLIGNLVTADLDIISLSNGIYDFNKFLIYPPKALGHGPYIDMAVPLARRYPNLIWNVAGNIWDIRKLPAAIPDNLTLSIGRALIADPALIEKSLSGKFDTVRWCSRRGDCHYYSNGRQHIGCPLEPTINSEFQKSNSKCLKVIG